MCLQCYNHAWDSYSPDGIQRQYGYGPSDREANYFRGKEEKGLTHDVEEDIHYAFNIADPSSMQERVSHVSLVKWPRSPRVSR